MEIVFARRRGESVLVINEEEHVGGCWKTTENEYCYSIDEGAHAMIFRDPDMITRAPSVFTRRGIDIELSVYEKANMIIENSDY